ncbi:MAG: hypothetical protein Q8M19_27745 [Reyranella sp.]|nr:hypothetical protein [Reyranella sp.]
MTSLSRPAGLRTRSAPTASRIVLGAMVLGAIVRGAGAETPVGGQQAMMPPHAVLEPERTDSNISGIVLACEPVGQDPDVQQHVLQLLVYTSGGGRLLPDRRAGAAPKAEPRASVLLDDRPFRSDLLFAGSYAVVANRTGPVAGLSDEFVAALLQARTMVLRFDLLEEAAGAPPRFDSETTISLDGGERAAIRAVAHCVDPRVAA